MHKYWDTITNTKRCTIMNETYKTTDIVLAATLKLKGCVLLDIEIQGTKGTFVFESVEESLQEDFDLSRLLVEPVEFNNTIKQLTTSVRRKLK